MKLGKTNAILGKGVQVWSLNLPSVTSDVRPSHVIHQDKQELGCTGFSLTGDEQPCNEIINKAEIMKWEIVVFMIVDLVLQIY